VSEDRLYHFVRHAEPVEVCRQPAAKRMPSLPLGQTLIPLELVIGDLMAGLGFPANRASIERGHDHAVSYVIQANRLEIAAILKAFGLNAIVRSESDGVYLPPDIHPETKSS